MSFMGLKASELLKVLKDEEVRKEIRNICREQTGTSDFGSSVNGANYSSRETEEVENLQREIDRLEKELFRKNSELAERTAQISHAKQIVDRLRSDANRSEAMIDELKKEKDILLKRIAGLQEETKKLSAISIDFEQKCQNAEARAQAYERKVSELEISLQQAEFEKNEVSKVYSAPERYLGLYRMLSDETKDGLCNVICDADPIHFVSSMSNQDSIRRIWEYTKVILNDDSLESDVKNLKEIFYYFFELYNSSQVEPVFLLDNTEPGDEYSDELHAKAKGSASSGYIREVLLIGYKSANTERPICKTVVYV